MFCVWQLKFIALSKTAKNLLMKEWVNHPLPVFDENNYISNRKFVEDMSGPQKL